MTVNRPEHAEAQARRNMTYARAQRLLIKETPMELDHTLSEELDGLRDAQLSTAQLTLGAVKDIVDRLDAIEQHLDSSIQRECQEDEASAELEARVDATGRSLTHLNEHEVIRLLELRIADLEAKAGT